MEVIEKKDLLKLSDDTFVRSILAPHGKLIGLLTFRGDLFVMFVVKV
jgi:hypothetical protein